MIVIQNNYFESLESHGHHLLKSKGYPSPHFHFEDKEFHRTNSKISNEKMLKSKLTAVLMGCSMIGLFIGTLVLAIGLPLALEDDAFAKTRCLSIRVKMYETTCSGEGAPEPCTLPETLVRYADGKKVSHEQWIKEFEVKPGTKFDCYYDKKHPTTVKISGPENQTVWIWFGVLLTMFCCFPLLVCCFVGLYEFFGFAFSGGHRPSADYSPIHDI